MPERFQRQITLPFAPDSVWAALTQPERLSTWFGARVELDLRAGGRAVFVSDDGAARPAVIEELEPVRRFAFRWLPFERRPDGSVRRLPVTRVEFSLEPTSDGTVLTVVESSPSSTDDQPAFRLVRDAAWESHLVAVDRRLEMSAVT